MKNSKLTTGQRLTQVAEERGITKAELALALKVSRATIYNWQHGGDVANVYALRVARATELLHKGASIAQLKRAFAEH